MRNALNEGNNTRRTPIDNFAAKREALIAEHGVFIFGAKT